MLANEVSQTILCISLKTKCHIRTQKFLLSPFFAFYVSFRWWKSEKAINIFTPHVIWKFLRISFCYTCHIFSFLRNGFCWKEGYKRTLTGTFTTESSQLRNNKDPTTISLSNHDCQHFTLLSSGDNLIKLFSLPLMGGQNKLQTNFIILPWQQ